MTQPAPATPAQHDQEGDAQHQKAVRPKRHAPVRVSLKNDLERQVGERAESYGDGQPTFPLQWLGFRAIEPSQVGEIEGDERYQVTETVLFVEIPFAAENKKEIQPYQNEQAEIGSPCPAMVICVVL